MPAMPWTAARGKCPPGSFSEQVGFLRLSPAVRNNDRVDVSKHEVVENSDSETLCHRDVPQLLAVASGDGGDRLHLVDLRHEGDGRAEILHQHAACPNALALEPGRQRDFLGLECRRCRQPSLLAAQDIGSNSLEAGLNASRYTPLVQRDVSPTPLKSESVKIPTTMPAAPAETNVTKIAKSMAPSKYANSFDKALLCTFSK